MQYVIGGVLVLVGFLVGFGFAMARMRRKLVQLSAGLADPNNPIVKGLQAQLLSGAFMPVVKATADLAEEYGAGSGCPKRCGHEIADLIRSTGLEGMIQAQKPAAAPQSDKR